MNLALDIGNSRTKLAIFDEEEIIFFDSFSELTEKELDHIHSKYPFENAIISSVKGQSEEQELLKKHKFLTFNHHTPLPLEHAYATPESLGLDRLAAVVAAKMLYQETGQPLLVIDMGTCITYDMLNEQGRYLGGSISPGTDMRYKALNTFTKKLPLVNKQTDTIKLIGDSTETSIISGVQHGIKTEIEGVIQAYNSQYSGLNVVLTGGDMNLFDIAVKNRIFADEFLVLKGLNEILKYNEKI